MTPGVERENLITEKTVISPEEHQWENELRPSRFDEFPGQKKIVEKLKIYIQAALMRSEPLDHTLFCGPPGLGKTTLAHLLSEELGVSMRTTSGPALDKKGDMAAILTSLAPGSVLFIDEIHRLNRTVEEYLYSAMEDFFIDIITGEGMGARTMKFQLAPFTLVGATTRAGLLNGPFRDRFGIVERLSFYDKGDLQRILRRSGKILAIDMDDEGSGEIAGRSRGTPRIANRLLKRVRDFAQVNNNGVVDGSLARSALDQMDVDDLGLDEMDRKILLFILEKFSGGPVGIDTIAAGLSEDRGTIEEVYEPFLLQEGLLQKTPRGRVITDRCRRHFEN